MTKDEVAKALGDAVSGGTFESEQSKSEGAANYSCCFIRRFGGKQDQDR
jgi:hypothetical protein